MARRIRFETFNATRLRRWGGASKKLRTIKSARAFAPVRPVPQKSSNQPNAIPEVNRRAGGIDKGVRGEDESSLRRGPRDHGRTMAEHFEFIVPGQFAARRPPPKRLEQFQSPALAIIANRGGLALMSRGRGGKLAVVCTVTAAAFVLRWDSILDGGTAARRQVRVRRQGRRIWTQALATHQRWRSQNKDQTNGNHSNHAWNPKRPMCLGWIS